MGLAGGLLPACTKCRLSGNKSSRPSSSQPFSLKLQRIERRQPHSNPFICLFPYLPRLAPASSRHLRKNPKQKSLLWGATQFSASGFWAKQGKSRGEYPLVLSRDFPQCWRKTADENLSGSDSPQLMHTVYHVHAQKSNVFASKNCAFWCFFLFNIDKSAVFSIFC